MNTCGHKTLFRIRKEREMWIECGNCTYRPTRDELNDLLHDGARIIDKIVR